MDNKHMEKAVSPVIATVIIVAVAIMVAIAVAYWVTGIIPAFTRYEELKISNAYVQNDTHAFIEIRNTGSADATIDNVFVRGRSPLVDPIESPLNVGQEFTLVVLCANYDLDGDPGTVDVYESGVIYEFNVKTAGGGSYPVSARAP